MTQFEPVIGLEIHLQLNTNSKLFCSCPSGMADNPIPNSAVCPVCTAQPGTLPVLNKGAVELAVKAALALNLEINKISLFDRKNYFYPDLPKGYQITQLFKPISEHGWLEVNGRKVGITRAHMEEDAGKSIHHASYSLIDWNRAGTPLLEIVSEPEIHSADEAYEFLTKLKSNVSWVGASNADMEKGELRVDVNISLRPAGIKTFGTKVEIKNLNSFKAVRDAINVEIERQTEMLNEGKKIKQETLLFDKEKGETVSMRSKEDALDYRYFPDPDLPPLVLADEWLESVIASRPEMPARRKERFTKDYGLSDYDAGVLTSERALSEYYEDTVKTGANPKNAANWITTDLLGAINAAKLDINDCPVTAKQLGTIVTLTDSGKISRAQAKKVFEQCWQTKKDPEVIVKELGLEQVSDENQLETWAKEAIAENPKIVSDVKSGNPKAIGALIGSVMKKSKGKANPGKMNEIFAKLLQ
ncbi:Glutamyl-tRNA(Gln) amidotransferase, B subunit [Elusimicrobium minutum Pei191]|uniref:Aspartyl/glutamyl-tRNA(Asn/Gln) amidotransferase subunit B n=1 Tax=Elusimicrobium minutum (strain Pei191) TaxID=445932 RepID=GATB_ELUMP|nr:Asp-tRNA(Asn)/Glu-tRNA(Gln) amidotransferase subunit GatB [Elusimicrobium minutum]B2KE80.1 RecName: Full=Aspartyl/glutamyl-tRNA(Asn/Gln) amidotransferase subunit B; Short=Asp/Glu-ADT subunit B [Elusimicrobium minutum Pei191]ACC98826.1 Glutamyl-tRNA(Gln) amidotransferase, B subunit [Elusimicrobium minutum Pei191]